MKEKLLKILLDRANDLDRVRTKALATQNWPKVIEVEAQIHENKLIRKQLMDLAEAEVKDSVQQMAERRVAGEVVPS